jgi:hypothetical protein
VFLGAPILRWPQSLTAMRSTFGFQGYLFVSLSFITLIFSGILPSDLPPIYKYVTAIVAIILFVIGLLVGLLRIFVPYFQTRPARGLLDGLAASTLAALIGGYFGYGHHTGEGYDDPAYIRLIWCALFTIPVGALIGLAFDMFQSDHDIQWRLFFGTLLAALIADIGIILGLFQLFIPTMTGRGVTLGDMHLICVIFIAASILITSIQFKWNVTNSILRVRSYLSIWSFPLL